MNESERGEIRYLCEYGLRCAETAVGYSSWDGWHHPLCAEHLNPKYHPRYDTQRGRLVEGPITRPCHHVVSMTQDNIDAAEAEHIDGGDDA